MPIQQMIYPDGQTVEPMMTTTEEEVIRKLCICCCPHSPVAWVLTHLSGASDALRRALDGPLKVYGEKLFLFSIF